MSLATFFVCWWIVLFAVLPWRFNQDSSDQPDPFAEANGAPRNAHLLLKFAITTGLSLLVFGVIYAVVTYKLLPVGEIVLQK
jgi:predicted secreted protein